MAATGRRVLLVEGTDDVTAFQNFLSRKFPTWEQGWILAPAGSKKNVLEALTLEANWLGVVDCDAWTDEQIAEKRRNLANLLVLPRFCIESYLDSTGRALAGVSAKTSTGDQWRHTGIYPGRS